MSVLICAIGFVTLKLAGKIQAFLLSYFAEKTHM